MSSPADTNSKNKTKRSPVLPPNLRTALSLPREWLAMYDDYVTKNAGQVSQMESALRSLTYIIPGTRSSPDNLSSKHPKAPSPFPSSPFAVA